MSLVLAIGFGASFAFMALAYLGSREETKHMAEVALGWQVIAEAWQAVATEAVSECQALQQTVRAQQRAMEVEQ